MVDVRVEEFKLRDVSISRALMIPETDEGVDAAFSMRPTPTSSVRSSQIWREFRVFSYTPDGLWAENCRGLVSATPTSTNPNGVPYALKNALDACASKVDCNAFYESVDTAGIYYGPEFQGPVDISSGPGQAVGIVQVTDTRAGMPAQFEFDRLVHPTTMDAFLQMSIPALSGANPANLNEPYVPTFIEEIAVSSNILTPSGARFDVVANTNTHEMREACADILVLELNCSKPVVSIAGLNCTALKMVKSNGADGPRQIVPKHCFRAVWEPDVDLISERYVNRVLREGLNDRKSRTRFKDFGMLAYYFIDRALRGVKEDEAMTMLPHHQKLFSYLQHQQQTEEWLRLGGSSRISSIPMMIDEVYSDFSEHEGQMVIRIGQALPSISRKQEDPLALMMQDSLLDKYYTVGCGVPFAYPQLTLYLTMLSYEYPNLNYLEIGAGTEGTTSPFLQALSGYKDLHTYPRFKFYAYTDISTGFVEKAADKFWKFANFMEFKKPDSDKDPARQGFQHA